MKIGIFCNQSTHQEFWGKAFAEGLEKHGADFFVEDHRTYMDCDLAVFWSHKKHHIIQEQKAKGAQYLVLERGFIGDRLANTSTGFNGLCGRAEWVTKDDPSRFKEKFGDLLKPWKPEGEGDYILVIGQCPGDAALNGMNFDRWLNQLQHDLAHFNLPIKFRPHPLAGNVTSPFERLSPDDPIENHFIGARFVVTFSSTAGVESVLYGVPTVTIDPGSMAYPVGGHDLMVEPPRPDRDEWAEKLAWCQWTEEEFRNGVSWETLKGFFKC